MNPKTIKGEGFMKRMFGRSVILAGLAVFSVRAVGVEDGVKTCLCNKLLTGKISDVINKKVENEFVKKVILNLLANQGVDLCSTALGKVFDQMKNLGVLKVIGGNKVGLTDPMDLPKGFVDGFIGLLADKLPAVGSMVSEVLKTEPIYSLMQAVILSALNSATDKIICGKNASGKDVPLSSILAMSNPVKKVYAFSGCVCNGLKFGSKVPEKYAKLGRFVCRMAVVSVLVDATKAKGKMTRETFRASVNDKLKLMHIPTDNDMINTIVDGVVDDSYSMCFNKVKKDIPVSSPNDIAFEDVNPNAGEASFSEADFSDFS